MNTSKSGILDYTNIAVFALALATVTIFLYPGCAATETREGTGSYIDDATITTQVKAELINPAFP
jgi:hypothetical protein